MDLSKSTGIVTGVSKGIGKATVLDLLNKGAKVIGWGRTNPNIDNDNFTFIETDVSNADSVKNVLDESKKLSNGDFHFLINNAGLGYFKIMEELKEEEWRAMFDVNVHGIFNCSKALIPIMKAQDDYAHIINISSIAGLMGMPEGTGYCGTKYAVKGISEAMFKELRQFNIKVSCIYPGSVNTDFFDNYEGIDANDTMMKATDISRTILQVLETPDNVITMNVEIRPLNTTYKV